MRHGLMACAAVFALGGCDTLAKPHNDVLIFGTTTKVALDVSAPVQNGALPEFTLGYKRNEAVWMPLKPNTVAARELAGASPSTLANYNKCMADEAKLITDNGERTKFCAAKYLTSDKYLAISAGIDAQKGGTALETDTYSVFASFGGRGGLGFNESSGQLAQFFATGIAAQRLGANSQLAAALNADGEKPAEKAAEAAGKAADAKKSEAETEAEKERTKQAAIYANAGIDALKREITALDVVWTDCPADGDAAKFQEVLADAKTRVKTTSYRSFASLKTKIDVMTELQAVSTPEEVKGYRDALLTKCRSS